ncbi:hypothetical protein C8R45DRAFT_943034 [Mycena sanguinolenta]|nr:hypothetical protein C8R45DRAFT_943034 [Mycena sanguinolenta]
MCPQRKLALLPYWSALVQQPHPAAGPSNPDHGTRTIDGLRNWSPRENTLIGRKAGLRDCCVAGELRPGQLVRLRVYEWDSPKSAVEEGEFEDEFHSMSDRDPSVDIEGSSFAPLEKHDYPQDQRSESSSCLSSPMDTSVDDPDSRESRI